MSTDREIYVPDSWCVPLYNKPSIKLRERIADWMTKTGLASKTLAQKAVEKLNPFQYMNILFPKVDLSDSSAARLYEINAALIVGGYTADDVIETYSLEALKELDYFFRSTEAWVAKLEPSDYPTVKEIAESLSEFEMEMSYSKAVICMFIDSFNQYCYEIWRAHSVSFSKMSQFRRRLSASVTAYLEIAMETRRGDANIDEKEFLWQRSADNLGFPVLMLTEVLSGLLNNECEIPLVTLHYFHMYSNLFAHVLNDMNSYHRDIHTDHNSIVKLWKKKGIAIDFDDAATKVVQFLNSVTKHMQKSFKKVQQDYPNCLALRKFLENISYTFTGWVLVHSTAVERYKLSPYQANLVKVEPNGEEEWLEDDSEFGNRCVQMFDQLLCERENEMVFLYGLE